MQIVGKINSKKVDNVVLVHNNNNTYDIVMFEDLVSNGLASQEDYDKLKDISVLYVKTLKSNTYNELKSKITNALKSEDIEDIIELRECLSNNDTDRYADIKCSDDDEIKISYIKDVFREFEIEENDEEKIQNLVDWLLMPLE